MGFDYFSACFSTLKVMGDSADILSRFLIVVVSGFLYLAFQPHIFGKNEHLGPLFAHAFWGTCVYIPFRRINRQMYMLYRFIFYIYNYPIDFHHYIESVFKNSFISSSNILAILTRLAKIRCVELGHYFDIVA